MRAVIQRVQQASVISNGELTGEIGPGLLVLIGIECTDTEEDALWLIQKITQIRIFGDAEGKMNRSLMDVSGELLVISQFTLHASTKKGNRPSFIQAARPEQAIPLYHFFIDQCKKTVHTKVQTGVFGADMKVSLINDGPVTITMDSKNKE
jgi:D-tyrosyl-tRNA(Tyr) deacylase